MLGLIGWAAQVLNCRAWARAYLSMGKISALFAVVFLKSCDGERGSLEIVCRLCVLSFCIFWFERLDSEDDLL